MNTDAFSRGRFVPHLDSALPQARPRILNKAGGFDQYMYETPPWGFILAIESTDSPLEVFYVEFETRDLPAGTMLGMRWTPASGNGVHQVTRRLDGNGTKNLHVAINQGWLIESTGQHVLVEHEVVLPDGTVIIGESFNVWVSRRVALTTVEVEGLEDGDALDPAMFPDGISVNYGPIENIEEYNDVVLFWMVWGINPPVQKVIGTAYYAQAGKQGEGYSYVVPPGDYTGFENGPYQSIRFSFQVLVKTIPWPNEVFFEDLAVFKFPFKES